MMFITRYTYYRKSGNLSKSYTKNGRYFQSYSNEVMLNSYSYSCSGLKGMSWTRVKKRQKYYSTSHSRKKTDGI